MAILDSPTWRRGVARALASAGDLSALDGATVLVTGGTGLVLSPVVDVLLARNERAGAGTRVVVAARSEEEVAARFGAGAPGLSWARYDATEAVGALPACDYVVHGASNAHPAAIAAEPAETLLAGVLGTSRLLGHARSCGARLLLVSSSEVYGRGAAAPHREGEYGWVDPLDPRGSYPVGKMAAEALCAAYAAEYGVAALAVRPGHVYGPTASPADSRVGSAWAWAAARGEDVVMLSDGSQRRSYVHCLDCATALLRVLLGGEPGRAYNVARPGGGTTVAELASLYAAAGGVRVVGGEATGAQRRAFNPMDDSTLDPSALLGLGWRPLYGAAEGATETVTAIRESLGASREGGAPCC